MTYKINTFLDFRKRRFFLPISKTYIFVLFLGDPPLRPTFLHLPTSNPHQIILCIRYAHRYIHIYIYTSRPLPGTEDKTKQPAPLYSLRFLASDKGKLPKALWAALPPTPPAILTPALS